jgi:AraC-like DNA-binding protein
MKGMVNVSINLNKITEEYAKLHFEPLDAFFTEWSTKNAWAPFNTEVSAFHFSLKGKAEFNFAGNSYSLLPGKVVHGAPEKWLTTQVAGGFPCEFLTLYYDYEGTDASYIHSPYELEIGMNSRIISMLWQLANLYKSYGGLPNAHATLQAKTLVYSVLSEMFFSARSIQQTNAHSVVEDAKAYVERLYMEQHTLQELGRRYGMNGKYFSDVFKKHTGVSPIDYLIAYRLEQARKLLESTECSVWEIGKNVGYEDEKYFYRLFKRKFSVSPSEWREYTFHKSNRKWST